MLPLLWLTWLAAYALPLVGAYLIINGIDIDRQATTVYGQILARLGIGFGLLAIGLGALIGVVKTGFARLEKRLSPAPETLPPAPLRHPNSYRPRQTSHLCWIGLDR
jgi:hypothetical protein